MIKKTVDIENTIISFNPNVKNGVNENTIIINAKGKTDIIAS